MDQNEHHDQRPDDFGNQHVNYGTYYFSVNWMETFHVILQLPINFQFTFCHWLFWEQDHASGFTILLLIAFNAYVQYVIWLGACWTKILDNGTVFWMTFTYKHVTTGGEWTFGHVSKLRNCQQSKLDVGVDVIIIVRQYVILFLTKL